VTVRWDCSAAAFVGNWSSLVGRHPEEINAAISKDGVLVYESSEIQVSACQN
jgi:hypothetical protein